MRKFVCIVLLLFCVGLCGCFRTPEDDFKGLFEPISDGGIGIFKYDPEKRQCVFFHPEKRIIAMFHAAGDYRRMLMFPVVATLLRENTLYNRS